ncbi:MAG: DUF465 domain-containing protein [Candidatus Acidiferrales bacterium]
MSTTAQEIRNSLMAQDAEYQKLAQEHFQYESQLDQLQKQPYLSSEDLALEVTLKKMKLRVKDAMERKIAEHLRKLSGR